ncbi:hypothetical protein J6590_000950 [Homalodisca vitripennis]|nr:hypothetical protein J6590_000950 [Homalodisca vitripennis]
MALGVWGLTVMFAVVQVIAVPLDSDNELGLGSGLKVLRKLYDDCSRKDSAVSCLKGKAITFFDRATRSDSIPLGDLVFLVKEEGSRLDYGRALTENDVEAVIQGSDDTARDLKLNDLLFDRIARFFNSHTIKLALPKVSSQDLARGYEEDTTAISEVNCVNWRRLLEL